MYNSLDNHLPIVYLKSGEACLCVEPARVITVLGSCVSVILYSPSRRIGAICHAVMPTHERKTIRKHSQKDLFQYVDSSIEWMISEFEKIMIREVDLEAKVFGGAGILVDSLGKAGTIAIGRKNAETALRILGERRLRLTAWNVGGTMGRKIIFHTATGEVLIKYVKELEPQTQVYCRGGGKK